MGRTAKRHLALFAYYYPPLGGAGSRRALSFARGLPALGWRVTVITPRDGVYGKDAGLPAGDLPGARVVRTGSFEPAALLRRLRGAPASDEAPAAGDFVEEAELGTVGSALRSLARRVLYFPDASGGWVRPAVAAARAAHAEDPFDLVLSSSPPISAHLAARRFARGAGLPLLLDFRDLWEPAVGDRSGRARRLLGGLLHSAAGVATVSRGYADWFAAAGAASAAVVRNGFEPAGGEREAAPAGPPFLLHAGTTYGARQDFLPLVGAVMALRATGSPLLLRMPGRVDAATRGALAPAAAAGAVTLEGFLPSAEVARLESAAAAIVAFAWSGPEGDPVSAGHLPAKLFGALGSGRPVLLLAEPGTEAAALGAEVGLRAVSPRDGARLREVLAALSRGEVPPGLLPDPAAAGRFSRESAAADLARVLDASCEGAGVR